MRGWPGASQHLARLVAIAVIGQQQYRGQWEHHHAQRRHAAARATSEVSQAMPRPTSDSAAKKCMSGPPVVRIATITW